MLNFFLSKIYKNMKLAAISLKKKIGHQNNLSAAYGS